MNAMDAERLKAYIDTMVDQQDGPVFSQAAPQPAPLATWLCPIHRQVKVVPAGFSQKTQRAYSSFLACPAPGCDQRPPRNGPVGSQGAPYGPGMGGVAPEPTGELP